MKIGRLWISPGRRRFQPSAFTVPWVWVEAGVSARTVLWGGHPSRDVWVGSAEDRQRERYRWQQERRRRRQAAEREAMTRFTRSVTAQFGAVSVQMAEFARATRRAQVSLSALADVQQHRTPQYRSPS